MGDWELIQALDKKRGEIAGELALAEERAIELKDQIRTLEAAMRVAGYEGFLQVPVMRPAAQLFARGEIARMTHTLACERPELTVNRVIALEIMNRKGWDTGNLALWARVARSVKEARKGRRGGPSSSSRCGSNSPSTPATPDA